MLKKIITILSVVIISYLISLSAKALLSIPKEANIISNSWQILSPTKSVSEQIPNTFVLDVNNTPKFTEGLYILNSKFNVKEDLKRAYFIMTQQPDHGFRIWIDNKFITEVGDVENGEANIWRSSGFFPIPGGITKGIHNIKLEIYAVEQVSLLTSPYIINIHQHALKYLGIEFLNNHLIIFITGVTCAFGVLFISLGFIDLKKEKLKIILGLAFILIAVYFADFLSIEILLVKYLTFRKITFICLTLGFLLTYLVIVSSLDGRIRKSRIVKAFVIALASIVVLAASSNIDIFQTIKLPIIIIGLIFFTRILFHPKLLFWEKQDLNSIVIGIISLSFFTIRYIYYSIVKTPYTVLVHLGLFIYILSVFFYFLSDYMEKSKKVAIETLRADHYFNKSVIDPLTNVNNRNILSYISLIESQFILFICDLDDFKIVNDKYGHQIGDEVLIKFSYIIKRFVRDSDYIIRMGGDEFVIVLTSCSLERGLEIGKKIWSAIAEELISVDDGTISFSVSGGGVESKLGESFASALKRADDNLYDIKKEKKGTFKIL